MSLGFVVAPGVIFLGVGGAKHIAFWTIVVAHPAWVGSGFMERSNAAILASLVSFGLAVSAVALGLAMPQHRWLRRWAVIAPLAYFLTGWGIFGYFAFAASRM